MKSGNYFAKDWYEKERHFIIVFCIYLTVPLRSLEQVHGKWEKLILISDCRLDNMDTYSNLLYVKEQRVELAHLAHRYYMQDSFIRYCISMSHSKRHKQGCWLVIRLTERGIFLFLCTLFNTASSAAPQIPPVSQDAGIEPRTVATLTLTAQTLLPTRLDLIIITNPNPGTAFRKPYRSDKICTVPEKAPICFVLTWLRQ